MFYDEGIGIPAADLPHIFQPFYREGNTRGRKDTCTGLSLAGKIIKLHGGFVTVTLVEEKGTGLSILLKV